MPSHPFNDAFLQRELQYDPSLLRFASINQFLVTAALCSKLYIYCGFLFNPFFFPVLDFFLLRCRQADEDNNNQHSSTSSLVLHVFVFVRHRANSA